jgi:beta-lactamase class A
MVVNLLSKLKLILFLLVGLMLMHGCQAPPNHSESGLKSILEEAFSGFSGSAGLYVHHLEHDMEVGIHENDTFPTASMIKVPIMIRVFDRIEHGELALDSVVYYYKDSINYRWKGDDAISRFKDGEDITISKLLTHMLTFSDNHASLWLQELAGSGTAINEWLERAGYEVTRVNSRTPGRQSDYDRFGWGQTTPKEMAELLTGIRNKTLLSPATCEEMYRHLTRSYWDGEALSQIPPTVQAASKQGAVNESRSEVVLVNAPAGDYVFCIITKQQEDTSWEDTNEGFVLIRAVSAILWDYFDGQP